MRVVEWDWLSKAVSYVNLYSYVVGPAPKARRSGTVSEFLEQALSRRGATYDWAEKPRPSDDDPRKMDCSGLVQWAAARAGVRLPEGSANQKDSVRAISVDEAKKTPGALLFHPGHVAISLGDGRTIEARMPAGVVVDFAGHRFDSAGLIPGLSQNTKRKG